MKKPAASLDVVSLLEALVAIPSVNPAFLPDGDPRAGEQRVALWLEQYFREAGLETERQELAPKRWNLIARLQPAGVVRRRLILAPHLDTVGEPALDTLLRPRIQRGRMIGRGAVDTKGCVASMASALVELAGSKHLSDQTEILFVGLADEEHRQLGSRSFAKSGIHGDLAIVGEPTQLKVVTAHKGGCWMDIRTSGKAAHGAKPHLGRNAILEMSRVVQDLEGGYRETLNAAPHPLLGPGTVSVGTIRGGIQPNIVPAECRITVDRRTLPGEKDTQILSTLRRRWKELGIQAKVQPLNELPCDSVETDPNLPWVRLFLELQKQPEAEGVDFFCDAAPISKAGTPCIIFGPGDIGQAHTADEWISLSQLKAAQQALLEFMKRLP